jgi:hypothetical protein
LHVFKEIAGDFSFQPDAVEEAIKRKGMFNVVYLPSFLKLDFWLLKNEPFDRSRFGRRRMVTILGRPMRMASAEDTILQKLRWYKEAKIEKHLVDAAFVYQTQKKNLDNNYLKKWAKTLLVTEFFKELEKIDLEEYI